MLPRELECNVYVIVIVAVVVVVIVIVILSRHRAFLSAFLRAISDRGSLFEWILGERVSTRATVFTPTFNAQ